MARIEVHRIAQLPHDGAEHLVVGAHGEGFVDGLPHEVVAGGLAVFLSKIELARSLAGGILDDRKPK